MRVASVAVAWVCRLVGGVADVLARWYSPPHQPWRKLVLGVYFVPGDIEFDAKPVAGVWSVVTPLGWFRVWASRRVMCEVCGPKLLDIWGVSIDIPAGLIIWRWGARLSIWSAPWRWVDVAEGILLADGQWAKRLPTMPPGTFAFPPNPGGTGPAPLYSSDPTHTIYTTRRGESQEFSYVIGLVMVTVSARRWTAVLGRWRPVRERHQLSVLFNRSIGDREGGKVVCGFSVECHAAKRHPAEVVAAALKKHQDEYTFG